VLAVSGHTYVRWWSREAAERSARLQTYLRIEYQRRIPGTGG
jgi:hypothetical protein